MLNFFYLNEFMLFGMSWLSQTPEKPQSSNVFFTVESHGDLYWFRSYRLKNNWYKTFDSFGVLLLLYSLAQNIIILLLACSTRGVTQSSPWTMLEQVDLFTCSTYLQNCKCIFSIISTLSVAQTSQQYKRIGLTKISKSSSWISTGSWSCLHLRSNKNHSSVTFDNQLFFCLCKFSIIVKYEAQVFILTNHFKFIFTKKEFRYFSYFSTREDGNFSFWHVYVQLQHATITLH